MGIFQAYNAALAIEVLSLCEPNISKEIIQKGLDKTIWPGRLQVIRKNPTIIIDGDIIYME